MNHFTSLHFFLKVINLLTTARSIQKPQTDWHGSNVRKWEKSFKKIWLIFELYTDNLEKNNDYVIIGMLNKIEMLLLTAQSCTIFFDFFVVDRFPNINVRSKLKLVSVGT